MYKLLICDDERIIREGIRQSIDWGTLNIVSVQTAKDGNEGWEWFIKNTPQFVITDIRMPKMDGIALLKQIMAHSKHTKVILLSGYSDFEYAQQGIKNRAFDYLLKPSNPEEIKDTLESAIFSYEKEQGIDKEKKIETDIVPPDQKELIIRYIEKHFTEDITLESTAAHVFLSPGHLNRILKKETGHTFLSYLTKVRMEHAKKLLSSKKFNVNQVSSMTGYRDSKYFSQLFRKYKGMTPSEYMLLFK